MALLHIKYNMPLDLGAIINNFAATAMQLYKKVFFFASVVIFFHYSLLLVIIEKSVRCERTAQDRLIIALLEYTVSAGAPVLASCMHCTCTY